LSFSAKCYVLLLLSFGYCAAISQVCPQLYSIIFELVLG